MWIELLTSSMLAIPLSDTFKMEAPDHYSAMRLLTLSHPAQKRTGHPGSARAVEAGQPGSLKELPHEPQHINAEANAAISVPGVVLPSHSISGILRSDVCSHTLGRSRVSVVVKTFWVALSVAVL